MTKQKYSVTVEDLGITISTGDLAKQANGSVTITLGETCVFVSATAAENLKPDQDYFPLTVDYREKFAAAGRFPGGYFKREGRPSEKEILTSRLCDRPLRPLFPKGFMNEVQIIGMLLSADLINEPDVLMVNAASAALMCSNIPFNGPVACVRIGDINGQFVTNPSNEQLFESRLDLIYVGNEKDMLMIEGSADQLSEERFIEALEFAHQKIQSIIAAQKELAQLVNVQKKEFPLVTIDPRVLAICKEFTREKLSKAVFQDNKTARNNAVTALKEEVTKHVIEQFGDEDVEGYHINLAFEELQEHEYRSNILNANKRVDGRGSKDLRQISSQIDVLPRVHGSSVFQRGETQSLVLLTLGTSKDVQELDALTGGAQSKSFILHYNFPPFCVGETGRFGAAGRREIGHGALAERSLLPVVPPEDEFPYSIRIISEIMESNGSSSMASVCGGCLALMDAGVPIIAPVAGISTGLITDYDDNGQLKRYTILTDILGAEDHFGDMDFKIAGSRDGITGFQLDLKIKGLPMEIAKEAIMQCRDARLQILNLMAETIPEPRKELKSSAPRIHQMQIPADKIGALIGPGGKNIKRITELTGAAIDINEDNSGNILVFCNDAEALKRAVEEIEMSVGEIEVGKTYKGRVTSVKDFGAFVECMPGKEGLVHVSELAEIRVENAEDVCQVGDEMVVKCVGVDDKGRVRLSRKAALLEAKGMVYEAPENRPRTGGSREGYGDRREDGNRGRDRGPGRRPSGSNNDRRRSRD